MYSILPQFLLRSKATGELGRSSIIIKSATSEDPENSILPQAMFILPEWEPQLPIFPSDLSNEKRGLMLKIYAFLI